MDALARRAGKARLAPVALSLVLAACMARTWARNADWPDNLSLTTAAVAVSPASFNSHKLLAAALDESDPSHSRIDRAIAEGEKGLAILDPVADWHNNPDSYRRVAGYYLTKGDQLVVRGPDGQPRSSPDSLRAYHRSLALFLHARSIVQASLEWEIAHRRRDEITPQQDDAKMADLERSIAGVELRLGDVPEALGRASAAQRLDPASAESYRQLSAAYLASGRADDAAVALVEGSLVTSNQELRQEVLDLYRRGIDTQGCATIPGPYGPAVNPSCAMVHKHLCLAAAQALQLYRQMGRDDLLEKTKAEVAPLGCL